MNFFGKEIPTDKINFVMNVVSFILGVVFFVRMQYKMNEPAPPAPSFNSERDSLIKIEARLQYEVKQLKHIQDSLQSSISQNEKILEVKKTEEVAKRRQLILKVKTDWEDIPSDQQNAYVNKIMSNLKQKANEVH